jgi:multiple sugar transport system substrate-binding protein
VHPGPGQWRGVLGMADESGRFSRRDFLIGVLFTGTVSAATTYFLPGGRSIPTVTLNFVTGADRTGARQLLVDIWNRANPATQIYSDVVEGSTTDQRRQMLERAQRGAADILNLDIINIPLFKSRDLIDPLPLSPDNFLPKTLVPSRAGAADDSSEYWAAPFNADAGMLFARGAPGSAVRSAAVPPLTNVLDGLVPPGSGGFAGQLMPLSSSTMEAFVVNVLEHALSRDDRILSEDGKPSENLEEWQGALEPLRAQIADGRVRQLDSEDDTRDEFRTESLPFMRNWPVKYRELQSGGDAGVASSSVLVGPLPLGVLGGQSLAIARAGREKARAKAFIDYLTSESSQKILAAYGLAATSPAAYADESIIAFIPHLKNVQGAVEKARPRPAVPRYEEFSDVLGRNVMALLQRGEVLSSGFMASLVATVH